MVLNEIIKEIRLLSNSEIKKLIKKISKTNIVYLYNEINNSKKVIYCSYCRSFDVVKIVKHKGDQRYKCKKCNKTFSSTKLYPII
jgi:transposase-like protein